MVKEKVKNYLRDRTCLSCYHCRATRGYELHCLLYPVSDDNRVGPSDTCLAWEERKRDVRNKRY